MKAKTFYYSNEKQDDFAGVVRKPYIVDEKYRYNRSGVFWKISKFIVYRIIMKPFAYIYIKLKFGHKVVNKRLLKEVVKQGYFMYGNHTMMAGDAFIPNIVNAPKNTYTVVHSDNISVSFTRGFVIRCGAIPLPNTLSATKNFLDILSRCIVEKGVIMIYPEAHIWPYYTGIRGFDSASFRYPIKLGVATYSLTNTFHKRWLFRTPKVVTYIDGPFYSNTKLTYKGQVLELRNKVYQAMQERSKLNTYKVHNYIKPEVSFD